MYETVNRSGSRLQVKEIEIKNTPERFPTGSGVFFVYHKLINTVLEYIAYEKKNF